MSQEEKMNLVKQNSERIKGMDDSQLKYMADMIKNKEMMKQMYKS